MIKPILYLFEGGEPEEVISDIKQIKNYIDKYFKEYQLKHEKATKRRSKKV